MTHLLSYQGPREGEMRLHDAEYRGEHYFDYRRYEKLTRGMASTPKGLRLSRSGVGLLKDAIARWEEFYKQVTSQGLPKTKEGEGQNPA